MIIMIDRVLILNAGIPSSLLPTAYRPVDPRCDVMRRVAISATVRSTANSRVSLFLLFLLFSSNIFRLLI